MNLTAASAECKSNFWRRQIMIDSRLLHVSEWLIGPVSKRTSNTQRRTGIQGLPYSAPQADGAPLAWFKTPLLIVSAVGALSFGPASRSQL